MKLLYAHCLIYDAQQPHMVATTIVPILQMKELRLREVKEPAQGHTVGSGRAGTPGHQAPGGPFPQWYC